MSDAIVRMSRQELYDLVWSEAISKLAPRYDLSDVGLRKVCTKHRIPVPARGHWQKVAAGKAVRPIPLPAVPNEQEIVFRTAPKGAVESTAPSIYQPAIDAEAASPPVIVSDRLTRPHAATDAAREALKRRPDQYGATHSIVADSFLIRVHPSSIPRALRIVDALAKACEARGFELRRGREDHRYEGQLRVVVDGFDAGLSLAERMRQEAYKLSEAEIATRKRGGYVYAPAHQYTATGEFSIKVEPTFFSGLQGVWSDSKRRRVEERLGEVMLGLRKLAIWRRLDRERQQAREARHQEEVQRCARLKAEIEAEKARIQRLEDDATAWKRAEAIRAFADARAAAVASTNDPDLTSWLAWARDQADRIDPLTPSPPSIIDTPEAELRPPSIWDMPLD